MGIRNSFHTTFSLVSRVRISRREYSPDYSGIGLFLPLIGVLLGILLTGLYYAGSMLVPDPFITVVVLLSVQYFLFNLFHFDGLLDTADAFSCFADREKRLSILKDVHVGAFALFAGLIYLAAKLYFLTKTAVYFHIIDLPQLSRITVIFLFFSYPASGRAAAALVPLFLRPARQDGLGALLTKYPVLPVLSGIFLSHLVPAVLIVLSFMFSSGLPLMFIIAFAGCPLSAVTASVLYGKKAGGFTGDSLGFAVEIGELLHIFLFYLCLLYPAVTGNFY